MALMKIPAPLKVTLLGAMLAMDGESVSLKVMGVSRVSCSI